jgi:2-polyprenyl-3-methyl-5-hydroxy-6-metoxy-1,4-benzoquinol methylase
VARCCAPGEYRRFFNSRVAAKDARRYRRQGLSNTAHDLVRLAGDVHGESVLDIGGGIGALSLELLEAGAGSATSVEISGAYEQEAAALLQGRGLSDRVERRVGDFVADPAAIGPHDVVVLHRVVCCYPDVDALVGAAAERTRRRLLLTYPQERAMLRAGARILNFWLRLSRCGFQTYVHPVERIAAAAARQGLAVERRERHGIIWESAALVRDGH